ncbi:MAG: RsiV family protein, partial [Hyphomonas sp.]
ARGYTDDRAVIEASLRELLVPPTDVPEAYQGSFVFEPSTEAGKVGGITVMFSPYDIGSYAEGAYEVTLSAAELAPILTEAWRPRFGGEPVVGKEPVSAEQ